MTNLEMVLTAQIFIMLVFFVIDSHMRERSYRRLMGVCEKAIDYLAKLAGTKMEDEDDKG